MAVNPTEPKMRWTFFFALPVKLVNAAPANKDQMDHLVTLATTASLVQMERPAVPESQAKTLALKTKRNQFQNHALARKDQDQPDPQAPRERQENQDPLALTALMVTKVPTVLLDHPDHQVPMERTVLRVQTEMMVLLYQPNPFPQVRLVYQVKMAPLVLLASQEKLVQMVPMANPEN